MWRSAGRHIIPAMLLPGVLTACSDENDPGWPADRQLTYSAACQADTLRLKSSGLWSVDACPEWITLTTAGDRGDIVLPIYLQQNDGDAARRGEIIITDADDRRLTVTVEQNAPDENGTFNIGIFRNYGLGWGYDMRVDYADESGIRGQIFDHSALSNELKADAVVYDPNVVTRLFYEKGESTEELQTRMAGTISGGVDLKIASAKVSAEFSKQTNTEKNRWYVWCRDFRGVKMAYFDNGVSLRNTETVKWCTTYDFRKAVRECTPAQIVDKYGTHLITRSWLGGKLDYYFSVSTDITTTIETIVTTVNVKLLFFKKTSTSVDEKVWTDIKRDFKGSFSVTGGGAAGQRLNSQLDMYAAKGEPLTDPTLFDKWYACFKDADTARPDDLTMVDFTVIPVWDIISRLDRTKGAAVKEYITKTYLK